MGLETSPRMLWSGPGTRKISFSSLSPSLVKILIFFPGNAGQNRSPPSVSGPEGFQGKHSTSSHCPSLISPVPELVEKEFQDPEFCKNVAGLERMLRVRARSHSAGSPAHLAGTCLSTFERNGSLLPELVAVSQESSLDRSHSSAVRVGDSLVESLGISKHDFEDGIVNAGHLLSGASCAACVPASSEAPADGIMAAGLPLLGESFLDVLTPRLQRLQVKGLHLDCLR